MGVFKIKNSQFLHLVTPLPTCITKIKFTSTPPCASPYSDNDLECYFTQNTLFMHVAQVHLVLKSYVPPCSFSSCNVLLVLMLMLSLVILFLFCCCSSTCSSSSCCCSLLFVLLLFVLPCHVGGIITYIFFAAHNPNPTPRLACFMQCNLHKGFNELVHVSTQGGH
jgi:hypothetical protein